MLKRELADGTVREFTAEEYADHVAAQQPKPKPDALSVTPLQLIEEFEARSLDDILFAAMDTKMERKFLAARSIDKAHPLVISFLQAQGFTEEAITEIFNSASER